MPVLAAGASRSLLVPASRRCACATDRAETEVSEASVPNWLVETYVIAASVLNWLRALDRIGLVTKRVTSGRWSLVAVSSQPTPTRADTGAMTPIAASDLEATFQRYLARAMQIPDDQIRTPRSNFSNVVHNAAAGLDALAPHHDAIAKLPDITVADIEEVREISKAYLFAVTRAQRTAPIVGDLRARIREAHKLRAAFVAKFEVLVLDGVVPASEVAGIRRGHGPIDAAGDCIALATLVHKHATAIAGHLKIDPADVLRASELGSQLLAELRSATAPAKRKPTAADIDARDRLWTLLETTWQQRVWRAGAWVFGHDVDDHIPALGSRRVSKSKPAKPTSSLQQGATSHESAVTP
jgi:hypothetical protein|nr:hypothetical protein [Kofleriaceae bacterium]